MSFNKAFDVKGHDDDHVLKQTFSDIDKPKDWKPSGKDEKGRDQYIVLRRILTPDAGICRKHGLFLVPLMFLCTLFFVVMRMTIKRILFL